MKCTIRRPETEILTHDTPETDQLTYANATDHSREGEGSKPF